MVKLSDDYTHSSKGLMYRVSVIYFNVVDTSGSILFSLNYLGEDIN